MGGRNAEPIEAILAKGKSHLTKEQIEARKAAEEKLKPRSDNIERPTWLDSVGKKTWDVLAEELELLGLLTNVDVYALAMACDSYSNYVKAAKAVKKEGQVVEYTNAAGATNKVANPSIAIANKYFQTFKSLCSEFGLTPAARARLTLPKVEEEKDEFGDEFD